MKIPELIQELKEKQSEKDALVINQNDFVSFHEALGESIAYSVMAHFLTQNEGLPLSYLIESITGTASITRKQIKNAGDTASKDHWTGLTNGFDYTLRRVKQLDVTT